MSWTSVSDVTTSWTSEGESIVLGNITYYNTSGQTYNSMGTYNWSLDYSPENADLIWTEISENTTTWSDV